ncbi:hypothetical protein PsorP6_000676 [Peronosclerospora sorghi]|uniref:Uncharacterized protein n=1 Tax=Peronosclerospora sorghi TaxID=230839 RepID=A0ACC0WT08_9STRA|nr:hypothetical protein PsorP6_000676 [Peronosclerospora sorghi]
MSILSSCSSRTVVALSDLTRRSNSARVGMTEAVTGQSVGIYLGNRTTPSYVASTDTERLIGGAAKNKVAINTSNTVFDAKRLIGRKFTDPEAQADIKHRPFKVVSGPENNPQVVVQYNGET